MAIEKLLIYGVSWCGDCRRTQRFLQANQIEYDFINIDNNKQGERVVLDINHGFRSVPTIIFPDGSVLVEPSNNQLAQKLKIAEN
jgi:mycoredoxin